jgi:hypothetical protein
MFAIGITLLPSWMVVASIWTHCEIVVPNNYQSNDEISLPRWCPQPELYDNINSTTGDGNLVLAKDIFAWVLSAIYMVYLLAAGSAWRKERKTDKDDRGFGMELEEPS